ncbi:unnamed protein product [Pieris macdunnoughi]|uniref:Uncharacterized protein n=1 Tax=Pieris macdunnoughi TaxID=345717 RepID=A0A821LK90_9NEOP|nr:unnamed protein product [Pieris macdunnoughi]
MPAPRALVFHGDRPEPVEGGRPTPPTSSGTGVTHFVSRAVFQRERPRVLVDRKLFRAPFKGPLHFSGATEGREVRDVSQYDIRP